MVKIQTKLPDEKKTKKTKKSKKGKPKKRIGLTIVVVLAILFIFALAFGYWFYRMVMTPNVKTVDGNDAVVFIHTGSDYEQAKNALFDAGIIVNKKSFEWVAKKKEYPGHVKPGRYVIKDGTNNNRLVNMLRGGMQSPVMVTFNNIRNIDQLAGRISKQIEADSASIASLLHNKEYIKGLGFNTYTIPALFIPNTYEFYWDTDAQEFVYRMQQEYDKFWNDERLAKAKKLDMTPTEVSTLASIVCKESNKTDEMPRIAGVYLNRLKNNWLLQADPTLIFALNDFDIKRVLNVHKEVESPYNTYKYAGLPPGPICIPSLVAINSVLDAEKHNYFYFCAKEDFSGYHNFAKTLTEHNRNAAKYQQALNKRGIK